MLYEKYRYLLLKICMDVLKDPFLAEDAVHNSFMKIAKNMHNIKAVEDLSTKRYLITIAKNSAIDLYRKRNAQFKHEIFVDELENSETSLIYVNTELDNNILDLLKNLPVKYRDVFILKYSSNLSNKEIAKLLRISEGNVRQRIARGKEMLQKELNALEERINGTY